MMLEVFGQQCCVRLHGPKSSAGFKLYATSANIVVIPGKRTQHVGPNNVAFVLHEPYVVQRGIQPVFSEDYIERKKEKRYPYTYMYVPFNCHICVSPLTRKAKRTEPKP